MRPTTAKGHIAVLGANVMWGVMAPVSKAVMLAGVVTPLLLSNLRMAGAALLFWILSAFLPRQCVPLPDLLRMAGAAMLGIVFNQNLFLFGVSLSSPADASIIVTTMPLWVMLLASFIWREPFTWKKLLGIVLGASGAILLIAGSGGLQQLGERNHLLGNALVLIAQVSYASYLVVFKNFIKKYTLVTLMKWMFTFAAIVVVLCSLGHTTQIAWAAITPWEWAGVAYVVVCGTFLCYILSIVGQKRLSPTMVGMYNYVQPVVSTLIAVWVGLDVFNSVKAVAIVLVFAGVYIVTKR